MGKMCSICGKPSGFYPLCNNCFKLRDSGEVLKCEECGKWHYKDKPCDCEPEEYEEVEEAIEEDKEKVSSCLICDKEANGYMFCRECYYKYKNKVILLQITNCSKITLLDESYEGKYTCVDGHIVKSKSERDIDNYLYYNGIRHAYEKAFPIDDNKDHDLHPDFYLPEQNIYIEHWGYDDSNLKYKEEKEYKIKIYSERGITLLCTNEVDDAGDINAALDRKLANCKKGQINFDK